MLQAPIRCDCPPWSVLFRRAALSITAAIVLAWAGVCTLAQAQESPASAMRDPTSAGTRIHQHLFLDETQALSLQDARTGDFRTFNTLQRLPIEGKTAWLRLTIDRADGASGPVGPLYLRVLPPVFESVVLHTPDAQAAGGWRATDLGDAARSGAVAVGTLAQPGPIYLQIRSRYDNGLFVYAGNLEEALAFKHKLAIVAAVISTMFAFAWAVNLWRALTRYSQLSLAIGVLFPTIVVRLWITLGYGPELVNLPPAWWSQLYGPVVSASILSAGLVFILLATAVFQGARWFAWSRVWLAIGVCNLILSFFLPEWSIRIIDGMMLGGALLLLGSLVLAALQAPESLKPWAAKIALATMVLVTLSGLLTALELQGLASSADALQRTNRVPESLLLRSLVPIALVAIASWTYERLHNDRIDRMKAELVRTTVSLELESKRLERQRNFTAMLAHELKNPLTASHMALSGIEARLAGDDPVMKRAEAIKNSLQEINAIVERCAEVDGYEQGQMPMCLGSFSVGQLMASVKASHASERLYTLMRGVNEEATLTSDLHYIKIILSNLLTNALKYSPPDSLVELEVRQQHHGPSQQLVLSVSNEIGEAGQPDPHRVFERFYRAEAARHVSGAGLGLWLSQSLAQALGAALVCTCEPDRVELTLVLPLDAA